MVVLGIDAPGIEIVDNSDVNQVLTPYGVCIILGSANDGTPKVLTQVVSKEDFVTKFGALSDSEKYVESFFTNLTNSSVRLYFYRVNSDDTAPPNNALPATVINYNQAVKDITHEFNPGGIIISPEFFEEFTTPADRTSHGEALDKFCDTDAGSYWISFVDLPLTVTDSASAVTAANHITSIRGNLATYQPWLKKTLTESLLPSAAMAAKCLSLWATGAYYAVPAGLDVSIKGSIGQGYPLTPTDLQTFHNEGINAIRSFPNYGLLPYDSLTLSQSENYIQINSVVCFKIVAFLLENALLPYIHAPIAGNMDTAIEIEATLNRVLNDCWVSGYLSGNTQTEAFDVQVQNQVQLTPGNSLLVYLVAIRPAFALQKIRILLDNRLGKPLG